MTHKFLPHSELQSVVNFYLDLDMPCTSDMILNPAWSRVAFIVLIDGEMETIEGNKSFQAPKFTLKGPFTTPYFYRYKQKNIKMIGADLSPTGIYRLTGLDVEQFKNKIYDASLIWPDKLLSDLSKSLNNAVTPEERVGILEGFLRDSVAITESKELSIIEKCLEVARSKKYQLPVEQLFAEINVSSKTLQRYFKRIVGYTAKEYLSLSYFEQIMNGIHEGKKTPEVRELIDEKFHDYSHLNKWFKKYGHLAPEEFAKTNLDIIKVLLNT